MMAPALHMPFNCTPCWCLSGSHHPLPPGRVSRIVVPPGEVLTWPSRICRNAEIHPWPSKDYCYFADARGQY